MKLFVKSTSLNIFKLQTNKLRYLVVKSNLSTGEKQQLINTAPSNNNNDTILDKSKAKLFELMSIYEEAIGLKEIKQAQQTVLEAEKQFVDAQNSRRALNNQILEVQSRLRSLRDEMDRLSRTDSKYLQLFTEEHNILKKDALLMNDYKLKEKEERDLFFFLSASLRDSQEKERARVERIKYLQLGLSIVCTTLGILSAYLINYFRTTQIKEILIFDKEQFKKTHDLIQDLSKKYDDMQNRLVSLTKIEPSKQTETEVPKAESKIESTPVVVEPSARTPSSKDSQLNQPSNKPAVQLISVHPYVLSLACIIGFIFLNSTTSISK